jgi:hypothetical protein
VKKGFGRTNVRGEETDKQHSSCSMLAEKALGSGENGGGGCAVNEEEEVK